MSKPGPARRPTLQVVREGNPGHRTKDRLETLQLPPGVPPEPDWLELFPPVRGVAGRTAENRRARERARREWRTVVRVLDAQGLLATVDEAVLTDHCVLVGMILLAQRDIARHGMYVPSERGTSKNPATTAIGQFRTQLKFTVGQLGLSPSARAEFGMTGAPDPAEALGDGTFDV